MPSMLICKKAYRKNGDKRGKIMCKVSELPCAHAYYCDLVNKYRQLESAKRCPGKEQENG